MLDILDIPELGKVEIVEVYEYYDQPVLYSCKNASDHFYLVVAAAEDAQFLTWLCVAISIERLNLIRSGKIDLHDAFADSENSYAIQVRVPYEEHASVQTNFIQSNQIPEEMLPLSGECLDIETEILPVPSDAEKIVKSENQEILNLTLNFAEGPKTQAPIAILSNILGKLQGVIDTIGMTFLKSERIKDVKRKMQMSLSDVGTGSFVIQVASTEITQLDFHGYSYCGKAIEEFLKLLKAGDNYEQLKELLTPKSKVAKNYTNFLKSLNGSVTDTEFEWVSPNPNQGGTAYLSAFKMQEAIKILEKSHEENLSTFTITGTLIGAFLRPKTFEIKTEKKIYKGHIADEAFEIVRNATLNQKYTAEIQEVTERSEATDELTKPKYLLLSLSQ
ncbi:hypothetical protein C6496_11515 [Candidatus Poribacteria bacterium]|nr:MAG: hypothetical protein C6496_11515 [Candidatus Poribacteria bacterium]